MGMTMDRAAEERKNYELLASIRQAKNGRNKAARRAFFSYVKQLLGRDK
jgi:hypothetical protein